MPIDKKACLKAIAWIIDQRKTGKEFRDDYGLEQVLEVYEAAKKTDQPGELPDIERLRHLRETLRQSMVVCRELKQSSEDTWMKLCRETDKNLFLALALTEELISIANLPIHNASRPVECRVDEAINLAAMHISTSPFSHNAGKNPSGRVIFRNGLEYLESLGIKLFHTAKLTKRESGDRWQTMDTAPKDKGPILVASATRHQVGGKSFPYCHVVTWDKYHESWETWNSNHYSDHELMGWQWLPKHPLSQIEGGSE